MFNKKYKAQISPFTFLKIIKIFLNISYWSSVCVIIEVAKAKDSRNLIWNILARIIPTMRLMMKIAQFVNFCMNF